MQFDSVTNPPEESHVPPPPSRRGEILKYVLLGAGVIYVIGSAYAMYNMANAYDLRTRLAAMEQEAAEVVETAQVELGNRIHTTSSADSEQALSSEAGHDQARASPAAPPSWIASRRLQPPS